LAAALLAFGQPANGLWLFSHEYAAHQSSKKSIIYSRISANSGRKQRTQPAESGAAAPAPAQSHEQFVFYFRYLLWLFLRSEVMEYGYLSMC
jgi:hypothetical protein